MNHVSIEYNQRDERLGGWTENFWHPAASAALAVAAGKVLATGMVPIHGNQAGYVKVRAQAVPMGTLTSVPRDHDSQPWVRTVVAPGTANVDGDSDYPETALHISLHSGTNKTKQWIKGIEDGFVIQGIVDRASTRLVSALAQFKSLLISGGFHIRYLDPAKVKQDVVAIAQDGTISYLGPVLGDGFRIRISGDTDSGYANKIWTVNVTTSPAGVVTTKLINFRPPLPFIPPGGNVKLRVQSYVSGVIDDVKIIYGSAHDIGRPTGLHGGRRKKAKKLRIGTPVAV